MARHYLDHASSSPPRPEAVRAIAECLQLPTGDPGRVHLEGRAVRAALETGREQLAGLLGVRPRQLVFTSGATEAINGAVWGAARAHPGAPIVAAGVEHSAVRDASRRLAPVEEPRWTASVASIPTRSLVPSPEGRVIHRRSSTASGPTMRSAPSNRSQRWSASAAPRAFWSTWTRPLSCGQVPLDLAALGADLVSISAHKFGGPPGIGALVVRRGLRIEPFIVGGQQERARRAGMENVLGIVGFGAAAEALAADGRRRLVAEAHTARAHISDLTAAALAVPGVTVVGDPDPGPEHRLPHLVCLGVEGVEAEPVLLGLDRAGIAVHSGSACSSESLEPSPVLGAMGIDAERSFRVSVGWSTTGEDVAAFTSAFSAVVGELRALR